MGQRQQWTFEYSAQTVCEAASCKVVYHRERADFWRGELATAEAELREHGIEFREYDVTGGRRLDPVLDPQRQQRVQECRHKLAEHERNIEEYEAYRLALKDNLGATVRLDVDDIKFFDIGG